MNALRSFLAVAEYESVSGAAAELRITQPALSRRIQQLEQTIGYQLFERRASGLALNAAGYQLLPLARDLTRRMDAAVTQMRTLEREQGRFTVVCPSMVSMTLLAPFIAEGERTIRDVREEEPAEVYTALLGNRADLAINPTKPPPSFASRQLFPVPVRAHFRADSEVARGGIVELAELAETEVAVPRGGSALRRLLETLEQNREIRLNWQTPTSNGITAQALAAGRNIVSIGVEAPFFEQLVSAQVTVDGEPLSLMEWAAWPAGHYGQEHIHGLLDRFVDWAERSERLRCSEHLATG